MADAAGSGPGPQNTAPPQRRRGTRPEETPGLAAAHYDRQEAARYTAQSAQIQRELSRRALQLLPLPPGGAPAPRVLADVGCGSGLSAEALSAAGAAWVGFDLSAPMLRLAAAVPGSRGRLALADMAQGLALRPQSLDGAVSVSALQWLCHYPRPEAALCAFFGSLFTSLKPGACAALQVYVKGGVRGGGGGGGKE